MIPPKSIKIIAPPRILFGESEESRKNHYQKQFELLIKHWDGLPWRQWGVGSAKNLGDLLREIGLGETELAESGGQLVRKLEIVIIFIISPDGHWLVEAPQKMVDGRVRSRQFPYISEKLRLGETKIDTALRAIREESAGYINPTPERLLLGSEEKLDENHPYNTGSTSYPGLKSEKTAHTFALLINKDEYKRKYQEIDPTGTIVTHTWEKIAENYWFTGTTLEKQIKSMIHPQ